jgi:site-specific DNA-methyltransferase (adenine-specific)
MPDNSVDSIVTDPPYGLSFMGKKWDYDVPSQEIWAECLRVLKPGGHLLAFAGTRTQHRMAVRIEDAGFEIRDMIAWVYGSGFPKSLDVSKAIDGKLTTGRSDSIALREVNETRPGDPTIRLTSTNGHRGIVGGADAGPSVKRDEPATESAQQWQGWGTALKPALEPITVARKPLMGTVAENVLEHGTGGLNIDGCRVGTEDKLVAGGPLGANSGDERTGKALGMFQHGTKNTFEQSALGRWPANLIHDGSDEVVGLFPTTTSGAMKSGTQRAAQDQPGSVCYGTFGGNATTKPIEASSGSAARFFYCAKASKCDRDEGLAAWPEQQSSVGDDRAGGDFNERLGKTPGVRRNVHPTVKPTDLMRYLCRLVTPPGGVVFDPFMGSGSTGKAAKLEGFEFVGCEMSPEYFEIARARIEATSKEPVQESMF